MTIRLKKLDQQIVVITGASSGIGLVTARAAAARGAKLVLAARNEEALKQLTDQLNAQGSEAVYSPADVGNEDDVRAIAQVALKQFGGFDTWVNNAGTGMYGQMLSTPMEDNRRLFETNFWGIVYGSLEAARHLQQGRGDYGGAIINVGSEVSDRSLVLLGMYSASKHAVKAFTDALRMELEEAKAPVSVTLVKPGATDTPFPQHAQNHMDQEPQLPPPVYDPQVVADVILHCAENPVRDLYAAGSAKRTSILGSTAPRLTDWLMEKVYTKSQKSGSPPNRSDDALYEPTTGLHERGNYPGHVRKSSAYVQASVHPLATSAMVIGVGIGIGLLLRLAASNGSSRW
jgi:short-subunit dehydrogenase